MTKRTEKNAPVTVGSKSAMAFTSNAMPKRSICYEINLILFDCAPRNCMRHLLKILSFHVKLVTVANIW